MKHKIIDTLNKYKDNIENIHHGFVEIYIDENKNINKISFKQDEIPDREPSIKSIKYTVLWQIEEWLKNKKDINKCVVRFFIMNWSIKYINIEEKIDNF